MWSADDTKPRTEWLMSNFIVSSRESVNKDLESPTEHHEKSYEKHCRCKNSATVKSHVVGKEGKSVNSNW